MARSSRSSGSSHQSTDQLIRSLRHHTVNTLTGLCRIERIAATSSNVRLFQEPMTEAWTYYVTSNQFLTELRGLTRSYPFCSEIVTDAWARVAADPESDRSWNLPWMCLVKMTEDGLVGAYAAVEAAKPEMWGRAQPSAEDVAQLAACFEYEWNTAIETMLRHWESPPTWF
ncbi:hypothetical protein B0I35DRAFT_479706 [Stachybotrys elegans]|uniref:Uncharacterized protein n=1 Tax=Stachybotrys elegans TaxID=80388 RepID=A0A8K0WPX2_9HYPO|nr:hypothetical protein B0I35DRAFT_479706 [Stachybotrys elegans]